MATPTITADPAHLIDRVREMIQFGRVEAARALLSALCKVAAPCGELDELQGRLLLREGRVQDALAELDAAIGTAPDFPALRLCRADARMRANDVTGAAADAAEAVILSPHNAQAKAMLGVILIEMGRPGDAVACLAEAVTAEPLRVAYRQGLAEAQERTGDAMGAAVTLSEGIRLVPRSTALRTAAIMQALRRRDFASAAAIADAARREGVADARLFGLLGHALCRLGRHHEALEAFSEALKLAPEDLCIQQLVHSAHASQEGGPAPAKHLRTVLDEFADQFETHVVGLGGRNGG